VKGKWLLIAAAGVLLAIAGGALSVLRRDKSTTAAAPNPVAPEAAELILPGKIQAHNTVAVEAPVDGTIEQLLVEPGTEVYEGQLLARIKNTGLENARDRAQAELDRAQSRVTRLETAITSARLEASRAAADATRARTDADRAQKTFLREQTLHREGATPRLKFEKAERENLEAQKESSALEAVAKLAEERIGELVKELDSARITLDEKIQALDEAKTELAASDVHSPVDGLLVARRAEAGQEVTRELKDLFQIAVEWNQLEVLVEPEPRNLERIHEGQEAVIQIAELPDEGLTGRVRQIKDGQVTVEFVSPTSSIRPGLTAQVRISLAPVPPSTPVEPRQ
jgi:multidrug resistance efflux pump